MDLPFVRSPVVGRLSWHAIGLMATCVDEVTTVTTVSGKQAPFRDASSVWPNGTCDICILRSDNANCATPVHHLQSANSEFRLSTSMIWRFVGVVLQSHSVLDSVRILGL